MKLRIGQIEESERQNAEKHLSFLITQHEQQDFDYDDDYYDEYDDNYDDKQLGTVLHKKLVTLQIISNNRECFSDQIIVIIPCFKLSYLPLNKTSS